MAEKKCALIIANSEYEDPLLRQLIAPAQDAEALAQVLRDPAISGFEVDTILNEPRHRVEEEIEAFFLDRDRDDLLLLYFSGHGVTDEDGLLYYAARNTQHKRLRSTAVAANFVNDTMTRCRSRRQVLLLDCCHSGAFARTKAGPAVNLGQQFGEAGRGRFILASSDAYQYSFEGEAVRGSAAYSVFTQAVVEGLRTGEADRDNDGLITLDELYDYVHRRVTDQTPQQSPRKWAYEVDGGLTIAYNPRPTEAPLPDDLRLAIESFFTESREAAIPRLAALLGGKHRGLARAAHRALSALAEDDSRRVASAAEKCLDAYSERIRALEDPLYTAAKPAMEVTPQPKPNEQQRADENDRLEQERGKRQSKAENIPAKQGEGERQPATGRSAAKQRTTYLQEMARLTRFAPRWLLWIALGAVALIIATILIRGWDFGKPAAPLAPLTGHQIAERNKPGVIMINSVWQPRLAIWAPGIKNVEELEGSIVRQVRAGIITPHEKSRAMLQEVANHPDIYLTRTGDGAVERREIQVQGSAFIITPDGYIVTNAHVVSMDADQLIYYVANRVVKERSDDLIDTLMLNQAAKIELPEDDPLRADLKKALRQYFFRGYSNGGGVKVIDYDYRPERITAGIPTFNGMTTTVKEFDCDIRKQGEPTPGKDVAIVKVAQNSLPTIPVGDDSTLSQGDQVYVMGFPASADVRDTNEQPVEAALTAGRFSRRAPMPGGWKAILTDAAIIRGNSGGPAFNDHGEVIGIATFGAVDADVQGINFLIPMSVAYQFIQELNVKPKDSEASVQYRHALAAFEGGDYSGARHQLLQIREENPSFPFVQEYLDRIPTGSGFPYLRAILWALLVMAVTVIWLFVKRRKARLTQIISPPKQ